MLVLQQFEGLDMLSQADYENYGSELIDLTRRAAADALQPELQQLRAQNQHLQQMAARSQNANIQAALDREVRDWRSTYADPQFSSWLSESDPYAEETRSQLLRRAVAAGDASRVVRFYQGFLTEAGHHAPAYQSRASQSRQTATGGNIYTRAQIAKFYEARRKGEISDADWARREADIFAASRQGRVAGALSLVDGTEMSRLR
jgi:hypothetical protein